MGRTRTNKPRTKDRPVLVVSNDETFNGRAYWCEVWIDWTALIRTLGFRASENKTRRASLMYGSIVVKAMEKQR